MDKCTTCNGVGFLWNPDEEVSEICPDCLYQGLHPHNTQKHLSLSEVMAWEPPEQHTEESD